MRQVLTIRAMTIILLTGLGMFMAVPLAEAKVRIYLDETRTKSVVTSELDCKVYEGKTGLTIGFKADVLGISVGPQVTLGGSHAIQWDKAAQDLIAKYKELCTRYNAGAVTMKEYNERLEKLDNIAKEMADLQEKIMQRVKAESKEAFGELDKETKGSKPEMSKEEISEKVNEISRKLDSIN